MKRCKKQKIKQQNLPVSNLHSYTIVTAWEFQSELFFSAS